MTFSVMHVDPAIDADSGAGTLGDPYGDLEYGIEQTTCDIVNGQVVAVKAGTPEFIAAPIETAMADTSVSIAWAPIRSAPLIFTGYTAVVGDGGEAEIDCGGTARAVYSGQAPYIHFKDIHGHNCGSTVAIIRLGNHCSVQRCHLDGVVGRGILMTADGLIQGCYVHDVQGSGIDSGACLVIGNTVTNIGSREMTHGINIGVIGGLAINNIVRVDGATIGIRTVVASSSIISNSIYSAAGSGSGIQYADTIDRAAMVANNIIEGFSAVGGIGIEVVGADSGLMCLGANSINDCETEVSSMPEPVIDDFNLAIPNEVLTASPFTAPSTLDMSPVDTGSVKEDSFPKFYQV